MLQDLKKPMESQKELPGMRILKNERVPGYSMLSALSCESPIIQQCGRMQWSCSDEFC